MGPWPWFYNTWEIFMISGLTHWPLGVSELLILTDFLGQWPLGDLAIILKVCSPYTYYRLNTSCEIALKWMLQNTFDKKSTLVQVMAWCCQAMSCCLSQCWSRSMLPYGVTRPQRIKITGPEQWQTHCRHLGCIFLKELLAHWFQFNTGLFLSQGLKISQHWFR